MAFFAVAAGWVCDPPLIQNRISSLSLDQEILDMLSETVLNPFGGDKKASFGVSQGNF
ncbi:MAG TPA: hypothetical protein PKD78_00860 [Saprospiraceae bacterium]|nr:hypothetical protein [Saprospiraceae bacterium]